MLPSGVIILVGKIHYFPIVAHNLLYFIIITVIMLF